jgi:hypothetical protein
MTVPSEIRNSRQEFSLAVFKIEIKRLCLDISIRVFLKTDIILELTNIFVKREPQTSSKKSIHGAHALARSNNFRTPRSLSPTNLLRSSGP